MNSFILLSQSVSVRAQWTDSDSSRPDPFDCDSKSILTRDRISMHQCRLVPCEGHRTTMSVSYLLTSFIYFFIPLGSAFLSLPIPFHCHFGDLFCALLLCECCALYECAVQMRSTNEPYNICKAHTCAVLVNVFPFEWKVKRPNETSCTYCIGNSLLNNKPLEYHSESSLHASFQCLLPSAMHRVLPRIPNGFPLRSRNRPQL